MCVIHRIWANRLLIFLMCINLTLEKALDSASIEKKGGHLPHNPWFNMLPHIVEIKITINRVATFYSYKKLHICDKIHIFFLMMYNMINF